MICQHPPMIPNKTVNHPANTYTLGYNSIVTYWLSFLLLLFFPGNMPVNLNVQDSCTLLQKSRWFIPFYYIRTSHLFQWFFIFLFSLYFFKVKVIIWSQFTVILNTVIRKGDRPLFQVHTWNHKAFSYSYRMVNNHPAPLSIFLFYDIPTIPKSRQFLLAVFLFSLHRFALFISGFPILLPPFCLFYFFF